MDKDVRGSRKKSCGERTDEEAIYLTTPDPVQRYSRWTVSLDPPDGSRPSPKLLSVACVRVSDHISAQVRVTGNDERPTARRS